MAESLGLLRRSGVACLLGIDGREQTSRSTAECSTRHDPREPRPLRQRECASARLARGSGRRSTARAVGTDALERFIRLRVPLDRFKDAFEPSPGKATLVVAE